MEAFGGGEIAPLFQLKHLRLGLQFRRPRPRLASSAAASLRAHFHVRLAIPANSTATTPTPAAAAFRINVVPGGWADGPAPRPLSTTRPQDI